MFCCAIGLATLATVPAWRNVLKRVTPASNRAVIAAGSVVLVLVSAGLFVGSALAASPSAQTKADFRFPLCVIHGLIH